MRGRALIGVAFVVAGLLLLLNNLNIIVIPAIGRLIWPGLIILVGVRMLRRHSAGAAPCSSFGSTPLDSSALVTITTVMGAVERKCSSKEFTGGSITAFMGGVKADFRDAVIDRAEATLDVFAMMSGLEINVPPEWSVESHVTPWLGGYEDKTTPVKEGTKRLIIRGTVLMGGIEVKN